MIDSTRKELPAMTTIASAPITALGYQGDDPTVAALRDSIYGPHLDTHRKAREIILGLGDVPQDHMSAGQEAGLAPDLLRGMLAAVGMPAQDIAADVHLRGALCDAAHIGAHHLHAVWTGNFDLVIWALLTLGNGSQYQRRCLAELNTGAALGVLALTEAAGTNGANQHTEARWDSKEGGFRLTTPHIGAVKFMPNVADPMVPKIVVVTARLLEYDPELGADREQGVLAFVVRLRTEEAGLAEGVEVVALSAKLGAAMDHGAIRFNGTLVPADALLAGDWGQVGEDGRFLSDVEIRQRFHRTIRPLQGGRLDLATSGQAAALATVAAMVSYKAQRPHGDSDDVLRDLATMAAHAYAGSVLGRMVRDMAARPEDLPALWFMVVKPTLTAGAEQILLTCRRLAGAQGHLRVNYIPDSLANQAGAGTAEGDNRVLLIAAGRAGRTLSLLTLDGTPAERPWWLEMIIEREEILGTDLYMALGADHFEPDGLAVGRDSAQVDLAQTTGVRLMASAAFIAAESMVDPGAAALARSAAAVVALRYLYEHGGWFNARDFQTPHQAQRVLTELRQHRIALAERLLIFVAGFNIPVLPGAPIFAPDYLESVADWTGWSADSFPQRR